MPHALPLDQHGLVRVADARASGSLGELRAALARGELQSVRRGVYRATPSAAGSEGLDPGDRADRLAHLSRVHAVARTFRDPVFTSYSAAALLGLPIIGEWPTEVYTMSRTAHGRRRAGVVEVAQTSTFDLTAVDGCLATSVEYTLLQLARHAPLVGALTATDAALHVGRFGGTAPLTTLERLEAEHERLKPYPRSRRADAVLRRTTSLADTPLETGSRLLIEELGFAAPELQRELWLPELGKQAFLDFYWPEVDVGAEADGRGKYRGGVRVAGTPSSAIRAAADTVIAEKDRENAIRRLVSGFDRWDWDEMLGKQAVEARLVRLGVPRVRRRVILI
ncbi:hypothetical protein ACWEOH_05420 [Agromyces sp. NPDC004153]